MTFSTVTNWLGTSGHPVYISANAPTALMRARSRRTVISHETPLADAESRRRCLVELVEQVGRRLRCHATQGRPVGLKVRFADFSNITHSLTLPRPANVTQELLDAGLELLTKRLRPRHLPVRQIGFGVHTLCESGTVPQQSFGEQHRERQRGLDRVADLIAARFGKSGLRRGTGMEKGRSDS